MALQHLTRFLAFFLLLGTIGSHTTSITADTPPNLLKVGFIYPNPPNDYGVVFQRDIARNRLEEAYPIFTEYVIASAANDSTPFEDFVSRGFGLIIACSVRWTDLIIRMAKKYPNIYWLLSPGAPLPTNIPNLGSADGKPYQSRFLSGVLAAKYTKTKKLGYVNAIQTACVYCYQQFNSFALGVWSVDPNITIHLNWVGSWLDDPVAKKAARKLISLGCDVMSALTNSLEIQRESSSQGIASIGQHTDMRIFMGQTVLTSNAIDWYPIFGKFIEMAINKTWISQNFESGLVGGGTQLTSFSFVVPFDIRSDVNALRKNLTREDRIFCGEDMIKYMRRSSADCLTLSEINSMSTLVTGNVVDYGKYVILLNEVYVAWSSPAGTAMAVVTSLVVVFAVVVVLWMVINREASSVKASSFEFCLVIWIGVILSLISIYFWIGRPSKGLCMARVWLGGLGFISIFSAVLSKNIRIWLIFKNVDKLQEKVVPNHVLFMYVLALLTVELIILLVWQFQAPLEADTRTTSFLGEDEVEVYCTSDCVPILSTYFAFKGVIILACCYLAFLTRTVQDRFNESKIIAFNCYNFLILGSFVVLFVGLVSLNHVARFLIVTIAILLTFTSVLITFFGYKMVNAVTTGGSSSKSSTFRKSVAVVDQKDISTM